MINPPGARGKKNELQTTHKSVVYLLGAPKRSAHPMSRQLVTDHIQSGQTNEQFKSNDVFDEDSGPPPLVKAAVFAADKAIGQTGPSSYPKWSDDTKK